jgi:dTDP-4-amino-4,6-dideoxygalactose transaminase
LVPFLDLKAQCHSIKGEIDAAVLAVLESTQYVLGQYVADFEKEFAKYSGAADRVSAALREAVAAERKVAVRRS